MRHELMSSGCSVATEIEDGRIYVIRGDINNLVQVLNNLLSNAIYAQKQVGGGTITIGVKKDEEVLKIFVRIQGRASAQGCVKGSLKKWSPAKVSMAQGWDSIFPMR